MAESKVEKVQVASLLKSGKTYSDIAKVFGLSRERIRVLANEWGLSQVCAECKGKKQSPKHKLCDDCKRKHKADAVGKYRKRGLKYYAKRSVVDEAREFFSELGLDVVVNAEALRSEPELFVAGKGVKCNRMVAVSKGHQVRFCAVSGVDWWYVSDGESRFVLPVGETNPKTTYIGEKHPLRRYDVAEWSVDGLREAMLSD